MCKTYNSIVNLFTAELFKNNVHFNCIFLFSRSQPMKRQRLSHGGSLRHRKLRVMESMLREQKKMSRAVEETCREVRRVMHQQHFLQVQSQQLQERMMNLLEKMIPSTTPRSNTQI